MLVQARQLSESPRAEVASVARTIPRCGACDVSGACRTFVVVVPAYALVGEDVIWVDFAAVLVDFGAVDAGGAATGFEMQTNAGQVGEFVGAPGTFDIFADVYR